jgi:hypothetical protein
LTGNWTDVQFSSFHILHVPNLVKSKIEGAKNKGRKAQGQIAYLTLIFTRTELPYRFSSLKFFEASLGWGLKNKKNNLEIIRI